GDLEDLERRGLRGARPWTWQDLKHRLAERPQVAALAGRLEAILDHLPRETAPPAEFSRAVAQTMEALAADVAGDTGDLWSGHGGEAMSRLLAGLIEDSSGLPEA